VPKKNIRETREIRAKKIIEVVNLLSRFQNPQSKIQIQTGPANACFTLNKYAFSSQ
jgi:hypothetical protein